MAKKRRTKGHGGIRKRDGRFCPYFPAKNADGTTTNVLPTPRSFATRAEAEGWLRATRQRLAAIKTRAGYTIYDAMSDCMLAKRDNNAPATIAFDRRALRTVEASAKSLLVADATPTSVTRWLGELTLTPRQKLAAFVLLRTSFNWMESIDAIERNPMRSLKAPKYEPEKPDPFTKEEARAILAASREHDYESFFAVELTLGLRPGEAFALQWDSVNLSEGTLHVRRTLEEINSQLRIKETPKTTSGNRVLALPEIARESLRRHAAKGDRQGAVWKAPRGGYLRTSLFRSRVWLPLLRSIGLRERKLYNLRHTALTLMLLESIPLRVVADIAGHASPEITMRTYAHVFDGTQRMFAPRIDAIFRDESANSVQNSGNAASVQNPEVAQ